MLVVLAQVGQLLLDLGVFFGFDFHGRILPQIRGLVPWSGFDPNRAGLKVKVGHKTRRSR